MIVRDQPSPNPDKRGQKAFGWSDVQNLNNPFSAMNNADSYAYYILLVNLADRGWRLSRNPSMAYAGTLICEPSTLVEEIESSPEKV